MSDLAAPCGLFCAACPLYKAKHDPVYRSVLAERMKVPPERAQCVGCRPASGSPTPFGGKKCLTYQCVENKEIDFCYQCSDFPCQKLAPCVDRAETLPHNFKIYSLLTHKNKGRETWEKDYLNIFKLYYRGRMVVGEGPKTE